MGKITPTITLTANAASATTNPGPLSFAMNMSATDTLDVTQVTTKIISPTTTHTTVWSESDFTDGAETAGTDGGFVWMKNKHASVNIMIGHGSATQMDDDGDTTRIMTLKPGEFAWFPWDFTHDIVCDASGTATNGLESWVFTRTQ